MNNGSCAALWSRISLFSAISLCILTPAGSFLIPAHSPSSPCFSSHLWLLPLFLHLFLHYLRFTLAVPLYPSHPSPLLSSTLPPPHPPPLPLSWLTVSLVGAHSRLLFHALKGAACFSFLWRTMLRASG